jgi:hypothetical protein
MGKETDEMRIIQLPVIPDENGWVKLPEILLQAIELRQETCSYLLLMRMVFVSQQPRNRRTFMPQQNNPQALCKHQCQNSIQNHQPKRYSPPQSTKIPQALLTRRNSSCLLLSNMGVDVTQARHWGA